jgi:hypothetical protein
MKIQLNSDELDEMSEMSDSDLADLVRTSLKKFRGKSKAEDAEDPPADPSGAGHGGRSNATLETTASQRAGTIRATEDAAIKWLDERSQQDARDSEAESIIPSYRRL